MKAISQIAAACEHAEGLLAARALGTLSPAAAEDLARHLEDCAECRRLADEVEAPDVAEALRADEAALDFADLIEVEPENYLRGKEIGRGGMGRIVRARDRRLGRMVAIKELIDERLRARFQREARLTARLGHPAIVSVHEAGRWPSGVPFYAMKYVAGRPLDEVIADARTLEERIGLLPTLITVADAIAYAHSERVVHRDLKPHNILVGAFGETVVVDWGLARDLSAPTEAAGPFRANGSTLTQAGAGTPAYMPPEQARGEPPDERVDVYALGATLHHVLAGAPPGQAPLTDATPRELAAIVARALAPRKEDRYPSAAELAAELRRFQNGQLVGAHRYGAGELARRWLRRYRSVVAVAAAAVLALAAMATVSVRRVVAERDRAEAQRRGAERLVDYMLGTLRERLEPVGRLDVLAGVGKEVESYLASAPSDGELDAPVLVRRGQALLVLGRIDVDKGYLHDARAELERARALCGRGNQLASSREAALCEYRALAQLGVMHSLLGDSDLALERFAAAERSLDAMGSDAIIAHYRSGLLYYVGRALAARGDVGRGRRTFLASIEAGRVWMGASPRDPERMGTVASSLVDLADLEYRDGRPEMAVPYYDRAIAIIEQQRALDPAHADFEAAWARAVAGRAEPAMAVGDFDRAATRLAEGIRLIRAHVDADPSNGLWRAVLATATSLDCARRFAAGDLDGAARACPDAEAGFQMLLDRDAERESAAAGLASVDEVLSRLRLARRDPAGARAAAEKAVAIATSWNQRRPGQGAWLVALARAELALGAIDRAEGRAGEARAAARMALGCVAGVAGSTNDVDAELALAGARILAARLDGDAAAPGLDAARARLEQAVVRWPTLVEPRARLAQVLLRQAEMAAPQSDGAGPASALRARARALLEPLEARGALAFELRAVADAARGR
jgi:serine/threonine protein kinase